MIVLFAVDVVLLTVEAVVLLVPTASRSRSRAEARDPLRDDDDDDGLET
jgi:hypothetical protein